MPAQSDFTEKMLNLAGATEPPTLTEQQRLKKYVMNTIGPLPIAGEAVSAGIGQWRNSPSEWGQGWGAFGERFANNMGYNAVRQTITYGTSIAFDEDNRYHPSDAHGIWPRTRHALVSTFTARHHDGSVGFSISSVSGVVGASSISSLWGPADWRGVRNIGKNAGISFAATAGFNVVREFLPDILRRPRR